MRSSAAEATDMEKRIMKKITGSRLAGALAGTALVIALAAAMKHAG